MTVLIQTLETVDGVIGPIKINLSECKTAELRAELARGLTLTADVLTRLGAIWAELERRGEDLSELRKGLGRTLPLIAAGRLAAEAVVAFAGRPIILRSLEGVPLKRQRELAAGGTVDVIDFGENSVSAMPLECLPLAALRLVFAGGEIRTPQAQRLALRPRVRHRDHGAEYRYQPQYDREAGTVRIGKMTVRLADLLKAVQGAELPAIIHKEEYLTVRVRLAPDEHKSLQDAAKLAELPDWEMVRKALRAFGLI